MHKLIRTLGFAMLALSLASCRLIYTPDVQQGNLLDKKNVDQLQPGMTKRQVVVLMGSPANMRSRQVSTCACLARAIRRGSVSSVIRFLE